MPTSMHKERPATPAHVPFYTSPLPENGLWCASFELALRSEPATVSFHEDLFPPECISEDSVYAAYAELGDNPNQVLEGMAKQAYSKGLSSTLLDDPIPDGTDAVAFASLSRAFSYHEPFDVLGNRTFTTSSGDIREDVSCFGFDGYEDAIVTREDGIRYISREKPKCTSNVQCMYYLDEEHHASAIRTRQGDTIVAVRSPEGETASEMFADFAKKATDWTGVSEVTAADSFSMPYLDLDARDRFTDISGASNSSGYRMYEGRSTILAEQLTKLHIDEKGGHVESEGLHAVRLGMPPVPDAPRRLAYDGRFALFLIDVSAPGNFENWYIARRFSEVRPYLALIVDDVAAFQH